MSEEDGLDGGVYAAFRAEVRLRLNTIETQLRPLSEFLLAWSGVQAHLLTLQSTVDELKAKQAQTEAKVTRMWFGAAGVVAVIEFIRLLPPAVVARLFGG